MDDQSNDTTTQAPTPRRLAKYFRRFARAFRSRRVGQDVASQHGVVEDTGVVVEAEPEVSEPTTLPERPVEPTEGGANKRRQKEGLFEKYGIFPEADSLLFADQPNEPQQRVTKSIRERVHHEHLHCHKCGVVFGADKRCICGHRLCGECRFVKKGKKRAASPTVPRETLDNWLSPPPPTSRTLTSSLFAGPRTLWSTQVVRRLCHVCHSPFIWTERVCQDCNHTMCNDCPRDPPEPSSHTSIPSRERVLKKPRIRVHFSCENCSTQFDEDATTCATCGHQKCVNCPRFPP